MEPSPRGGESRPILTTLDVLWRILSVGTWRRANSSGPLVRGTLGSVGPSFLLIKKVWRRMVGCFSPLLSSSAGLGTDSGTLSTIASVIDETNDQSLTKRDKLVSLSLVSLRLLSESLLSSSSWSFSSSCSVNLASKRRDLELHVEFTMACMLPNFRLLSALNSGPKHPG